MAEAKEQYVTVEFRIAVPVSQEEEIIERARGIVFSPDRQKWVRTGNAEQGVPEEELSPEWAWTNIYEGNMPECLSAIAFQALEPVLESLGVETEDHHGTHAGLRERIEHELRVLGRNDLADIVGDSLVRLRGDDLFIDTRKGYPLNAQGPDICTAVSTLLGPDVDIVTRQIPHITGDLKTNMMRLAEEEREARAAGKG